MSDTPVLHQTIVNGDLKAVEKLILRRPTILEERDKQQRTALHVAAATNHCDILEWLLIAARTNRALRSALDINAVDASGNSALHLALEALNTQAALLLLKDDASPFLPNHQSKTPLFLFFQSIGSLAADKIPEAISVVQLIINKGIQLTSVDKNGNTALHYLVRNGKVQVIVALLEAILDQDTSALEVSNHGESPLSYIVRNVELAPALNAVFLHKPSIQLCKNLLQQSNNQETRSLLQKYISEVSGSSETADIVSTKQNDQSGHSGISRRYPGLISRCRILMIPYPSDHVEVKVSVILLDSSIVLKLNVHMQVKQAIAKLREHELLSRINERDIGLFLPPRGNANLQSIPSQTSLTGSGNSIPPAQSPTLAALGATGSGSRISSTFTDLAPVWLDPELCLWHYGLSNGDLMSLKKVDAETMEYVWIKAVVHTKPDEVIHKTIRIQKGMTIRDLTDCFNKTFSRISNQFMGLYLYDEHHNGHWLDDEQASRTIDYYGIQNMDIIELKEKSVYKMTFVDSQDSSEILCSEDTLCKDLIKMIICCTSQPVDDPTTVGLSFIDQSETDPDEPGPRKWIHPDSPFGNYGLHQGDEIDCFSKYRDLSSKRISKLKIKSDPLSGPTVSTSTAMRRKLAGADEVPLQDGEELRWCQDNVRYMGVGQYVQEGTLFLTNCYLIFGAKRAGFFDFSTKIAMGAIARIDKPNTQNEKNFLDLFCKDLRTVRLAFRPEDANERRIVHEMLTSLAFPHFYELFAYYYRPPIIPASESNEFLYSANVNNVLSVYSADATSSPIITRKPLSNSANGALTHNTNCIFDMETEFSRLRIPRNLWRVSDVNKEYAYSSTYPTKFIVPASVSDEQLKGVFPFRSKGRISILTYYHPNSATITRCSQPRVGVTGARSEADEMLTDAIRLANKKNPNTLYLFDARPKANAIANQAIGMGYEKTGDGRYAHCKLEFLSIDNIHVMRDSYYKLQRLCETTHKEDKNFYSQLDATHWLTYIKLVLASSVKIARIIDREGCSVLLHCSDGWDRTAQLASLAQLFLSPFYRTMEGFRILVEKDWLSVGHKFGTRCGHASSNFSSEERSPIFLQFIDCVYQCVIQFPCWFEFNEKYLIMLMDHVYSCQFGTFLMNNERERRQANLHQITYSVWDYLQTQREHVVNPFYLPAVGVVYPSTNFEDLALWKGYYLRYCRTPNPWTGITVEMRGHQLIVDKQRALVQVDTMKETISSLTKQLEDLANEKEQWEKEKKERGQTSTLHTTDNAQSEEVISSQAEETNLEQQ